MQERVMSTPTWPVPYYQRLIHSAPLSVEDADMGMSNIAGQADWVHAETAKKVLNMTASGRDVVQHVENNMAIDSYVVYQNDTGNMAQAYCADLSKYLDAANKENKR